MPRWASGAEEADLTQRRKAAKKKPSKESRKGGSQERNKREKDGCLFSHFLLYFSWLPPFLLSLLLSSVFGPLRLGGFA
jgi:hypothetical protein